MIEVNVKHQGAVKFEVSAGRHTLICDHPAGNCGSDEGMTPPELFLSALATCAAFYAVAYLKKKGLEREGVTVHATAEKAGPPARLDQFHIEVDVPGLDRARVDLARLILADAQPGKILHEMRRGEMAVTGEVPFARYYGSVDSTPLFVTLAGAYLQRTGNIRLIKELWPNLKLALRWIDTYGGEDFGATVQDVLAVTDALGPGLGAGERARVHRHFRTTSRYEWMFWDMGYRLESWPV